MHWSFGPSLHRHYNGFFATTASADFSSTLMQEISPGKVQNLSPRADWLYLMRLDDLWASLFGASLPPAPGLTASSCPYGREFATRFFRLRLAATPCVSLRLPSSAPIGSFHPIRFCPCWAHTSGHYRSRHRFAAPFPGTVSRRGYGRGAGCGVPNAAVRSVLDESASRQFLVQVGQQSGDEAMRVVVVVPRERCPNIFF